MNDALIVATTFLGIATLVTLPIGVLLGFPLGAWLARSWLHLKERELELRRLELAARLREATAGRLPDYVDARDPQQLLAWAQADRELSRLGVA